MEQKTYSQMTQDEILALVEKHESETLFTGGRFE